jgi:alpha-L-rhamnosidase
VLRGAAKIRGGRNDLAVDRERHYVRAVSIAPATDARVVGLKCELRRDALGIGAATPRLSWMTETAERDWTQAAYEIVVESTEGEPLWNSGRVESPDSVLVEWAGPPLRSRQRCRARVRVWGGREGAVSEWSEALPIEAGLLGAADWSARFVTPDWDEDTSTSQPCPMLRREFMVRGGIERARLYVSSLGAHEIELNGERVGDHVLSPGWTSYHHRLRYETHDATPLLRTGDNAIGAVMGDGWYRGVLGFGGGRRNVYGERLALIAQLEITYADGTIETIETDDRWRAATGPTLASDIYNGETYDARLERPGWSTAGYDDSGWSGARVLEQGAGVLVGADGPPVRRTEMVQPVAIIASPSGRTIVDFGQNLVGRVRLSVEGPAGTTITLRHAEVLEDGELCARPLRGAAQTDRYTLAGQGVETWEPRFTFHGFRYVEIAGWPGTLERDSIAAIVCHSDMERTGWFECSDELVNRLHENIVWSMRGNFLDVPTDCPQRDERLGWTGDIQVFSPTACFLCDVDGFLTSWLADLAADQYETGVVPMVIPDILPFRSVPTAAWSDAGVIVPWVMYQRFGDQAVLESQYGSMRAWVDHVAELAGQSRLWDRGFQFGDWLDPAAPPENPRDARTDTHLVATAYFARSARLLSETAKVLGNGDDAARYEKLAEDVGAAFRREYVSAAGRLVSDAPTAYALALCFGLLEPDQRAHAGDRLARLVEKAEYHIATGFVGTPLICDALCDTGHADVAYRLLMERSCPSWLYPLTMGATTIWERWDSMTPDGRVNVGQMTSFNHYAFGAVGDWLHRTVAGLAPAAPGYRRIAIGPRPGGGLEWARARHRTPYGLAEAGWRIEGSAMRVRAVVPPNTTASVMLPGVEGAAIEVGSGAHEWVCEADGGYRTLAE